ncbi:aminopeptidase M1-like isoform X1 [Pistacia vera]|uniref:aminopeptidase M1-like isoform X1 n=2 Tax=Pistacia vera TaxID=55513 RepID=UPI001262B135|nr:aminopeptidase M1-like isoform X1 [Pistacia vera]
MEQKLNIEQFTGQARLPSFAVPSRYDLHFKLDLCESAFAGTVNINLCILEKTNFIVLNAARLNVYEVLFTTSHNQKYSPCDVVLDNSDEILVLVFDEALSVGEGVLGITFSGNLNDHLMGFYKCTYTDKEVKKNMAVTQFEPVHARCCFPCWDEPALKATFKITLDAPSDLTALSNMPIIDEKVNENVKTVYFEESPVMSTYLVAVVVGLFDHIEDITSHGVKVGVYCPVGKSDEGKYALEVAVKSLDIFTKFFSTPYPLPKLDMVAVPEFAAGAMENFGLIVYRESLLLYSDLKSTARCKQINTIVAAHEVAHQWFGNLVTMEWWTHLWLNEGFATWISYMVTDILFPEWQIWTQFLQLSADGLSLDALQQSHPIEVEVDDAHGIDEIFDEISYNKGSAVIRMLQGYLGDDIVQKSLSSYMKKYAWKNAKTEDLWRVISEESGVNINSMMDCWTKQKGYPVIYVKSKDQVLEFEQSQFLSSGLHGDGIWTVPITLSFGSYDKCKKFFLGSKSERVDISEMFPSSDGKSSSLKENNQEQCDETLWVKVNVEQSGFYRVIYDDELAARLRKAVEKNCLSAADKLGILDDMLALSKACRQPLSFLLLLMSAYREEVDYIVLSKLINVCYDVIEISTDAIPELVNELRKFCISLLQNSAEKVGWESKPGESHLNALLRGEVFIALANFGHDKTQLEAMERFQVLLKDKDTPILSPDVRKAAYIAVMRNATTTDRRGFDSLLKFYRKADATQEKELILRAIACSPDPDIVAEVLNFLMSDEVRDQDVIFIIGGISLEGRETAWRWLQENWDQILKKYGSGIILHRFVRGIVTLFCSNEKADEVESFFRNHVNLGIEKILMQSIERVRIKARWIEGIKQEHSLPILLMQLAHEG